MKVKEEIKNIKKEGRKSIMEKDNILEELYEVIKDRKANEIEGSYTNYLFESGLDKILKKVGEESSEVIIAAKNENKTEIENEVCDLIYHLLVLLVLDDIKLDNISSVLKERRKKICNKKVKKNNMAGIH